MQTDHSSKTVLLPYGRAFVLLFALGALVVGLVVWNFSLIQRNEHGLRAKIFSLITHTGRITYLDEVLTMSARLAAASGDLSYELRYYQHKAELDRMISDVVGAFPGSKVAQYAQEANLANSKLVEVEQKAFALVRRGKREEALRLLSSAEYTQQKKTYAAGIEGVFRVIKEIRQRSVDSEYSSQNISFALSFLLLMVLIASWFAFNKVTRRTLAARGKAEKGLRASQEGLARILDGLNSIVYVADMKTYELIFVNEYVRNIFGDITGKVCWQALQEGQKGPCEFCTNAKLVNASGQPTGPYRWEFQNTKTGKWYYIVDQAIPWIDGRVVRLEVATDITERKLVDEALRASERRLVEAQRLAQIGSWELDLVTEKLIWSAEIYRIFEIPEGAFGGTYHAFLEAVHPEDRKRVDDTYTAAVKNRASYEIEHRILIADGRVKIVHECCETFYDCTGFPVRSVGTVQDVTERVKAQEGLRQALRERDVLIREVHHRVKNNMQVISSLLSLQTFEMKEPLMARAFLESQNRIRSMALVHEKLYRSARLDQIDYSEYLRSLIADLSDIYKDPKISVQLDAMSVSLDIDSAIPCGLIMNELISNSFKYAFPEGRTGVIRVSVREETNSKTGRNVVKMVVADDGVGFPEGFHPEQAQTLGLRLVHNLVRQLQGTAHFRGGRGTHFELSFSPHLERSLPISSG